MNLLEINEIVKGLPEQALADKVRQPDGQIPPYLALTEINRRAAMRKRYQADQGAGNTTVADDILAGGSSTPMQPGGLAAAAPPAAAPPQGMPPVQPGGIAQAAPRPMPAPKMPGQMPVRKFDGGGYTGDGSVGTNWEDLPVTIRAPINPNYVPPPPPPPPMTEQDYIDRIGNSKIPTGVDPKLLAAIGINPDMTLANQVSLARTTPVAPLPYNYDYSAGIAAAQDRATQAPKVAKDRGRNLALLTLGSGLAGAATPQQWAAAMQAAGEQGLASVEAGRREAIDEQKMADALSMQQMRDRTAVDVANSQVAMFNRAQEADRIAAEQRAKAVERQAIREQAYRNAGLEMDKLDLSVRSAIAGAVASLDQQWKMSQVAFSLKEAQMRGEATQLAAVMQTIDPETFRQMVDAAAESLAVKSGQEPSAKNIAKYYIEGVDTVVKGLMRGSFASKESTQPTDVLESLRLGGRKDTKPTPGTVISSSFPGAGPGGAMVGNGLNGLYDWLQAQPR